MAERAQIDKGLKHLSGSEEIIGNIVAYCVNAHKADPSAQTMDKIRQYVADTANSVCGHVLTIAHNINSIIDKESKEIEEMSFQVSYVAHRIKSHQTYMSQLYMTKFQTLPRPRPVVHILRETIPTDKLPKYAKPKKPWIRQPIFDYSILDQVGSGKKRKQNALKQIQPKAAVQAFNPYANVMISAAPPSFSAAIRAPPSFSYDSYHSCVQADDDWLNCPGLDSDDEMITLSSGGPNPVEFEVNRRDTEGSKFCTTIFEGDADATNIEIRQVEPNVLEMIVHYLKHYRDSSWNANEWIEGFDINALSDIVDGANYMDIQSLYNLAKCALDAKEKVLCQWIDDKMRNILMQTKTNVVMQMIDDLLFVFDDVSDISELKLQTFSAMNMVYLVRKILVDHCQYFGIHLDEHETDIICKYFEQTKVNGKVFVELVQSNSFVSNVKDFVSQINQNKQQISDPKLQTLQQHILSLVS
eukprot:487503_1